MIKMTDENYSEESKAKRVLTKLMMNVTYILETVWATGVGVAAAMVISAPINRCRANLRPALSFSANHCD